MKKILRGLSIGFLFILIGTGFGRLQSKSKDFVISQRQDVLNEAEIMAAYSSYLEYPDSQNAKRVGALLPGKELANRGSYTSRIANILENIINAGDHYFILEREAWAGDENAADILFRLKIISDGASSETLCTSLGTLVRLNPLLFLKLLYKYEGQKPTAENVKLYVTMLDSYFWERERAAKYELEMRIVALERVKEKEYVELAQACTESLQQRILTLSK
jgi:hypothetical protein